MNALLLMGMLLAGAMEAAADETMKIRVQVQNRAGAPPAEVLRAEEEAGRVYRDAGIEVEWINCPGERGAACREADTPSLFVLTLGRERQARKGDERYGFALAFGDSNHAAVIYPRIDAATKENPAYRGCGLLGMVMAHELGHLLFRSTRHGDGVMKAKWNEGDFRAMSQRQMRFTPEQATALRRMAELRSGREGR